MFISSSSCLVPCPLSVSSQLPLLWSSSAFPHLQPATRHLLATKQGVARVKGVFCSIYAVHKLIKKMGFSSHRRKGVRPQIFLKMLPPTNCSKQNKISTAAQAGGHFLTLWSWLVRLQSFRRLRLLDSDGTEIVCSCVAFSSNTFEAAASTPSITVWTPWRSGWTLSSG